MGQIIDLLMPFRALLSRILGGRSVYVRNELRPIVYSVAVILSAGKTETTLHVAVQCIEV